MSITRLPAEMLPSSIEKDPSETVKNDYLAVAEMRQQVSTLCKQPMLARWKRDTKSCGFAGLENVAEISTRGPVTPDHTIHTKRIAAVIGERPEQDIEQTLKTHVYHDPSSWLRFLKLFFMSLGVGFTTAGIIFFFAYNWADLHKFVKLGLDLIIRNSQFDKI